jgi:hypothetical protein
MAQPGVLRKTRPSQELGLDRSNIRGNSSTSISTPSSGGSQLKLAPVTGKPDRSLNPRKLARVRAGARITTRTLNSQFREPATDRGSEQADSFAFTKICAREKRNSKSRPSENKYLGCAEQQKMISPAVSARVAFVQAGGA